MNKMMSFLGDLHDILPINLADLLIATIFLFGLYLTSLISYIVFHSFVEIFCVVIIFAIFIIAWNARSFFDNHFLLFLSIAYIFISLIDITHTFSYKGVG